VLENAQATRRNEISLLYYRQRSALTRTADNDKKIEELEKAEQADQATMRGNVVEHDLLDAKIAALTPRIAQLEKALLACAEKCSTSAVAETPPVPGPGVVTPPPPRGRGNLPPATVTPAAADVYVACPNCQAIANLLAAFQGRRDALQRGWQGIDQTEREIASLRDDIAQRQKAIASIEAAARAQGKPTAQQNSDFQALVTLNQDARNDIKDLQQRLNELARQVASIDDEIQTTRDMLDECNRACNFPDTRVVPPEIGGAPVICSACVAIAEALAALERQIAKYEQSLEELAA